MADQQNGPPTPFAITNLALTNDRIYGLGKGALEMICREGCRRRCGSTEALLTRRRRGTYYVIAVQCVQCGAALEDSLRRADFPNWSAFPAFDEGLSERYYKARSAQIHQEWEEKSLEWWRQYEAYLQTPAWQGISARVIARDRLCQACLLRHATLAHHTAYGPPPDFDVPLWLIKGVCGPCHDRLHAAHLGRRDPWEAFKWAR